MIGKTYDAIRRLPDNPDGPIYWVCYNEDMKIGAEQLIKLIKGESYLDHCRVISRDKFEVPMSGHYSIYYSPDFHDHIGNGAN